MIRIATLMTMLLVAGCGAPPDGGTPLDRPAFTAPTPPPCAGVTVVTDDPGERYICGACGGDKEAASQSYGVHVPAGPVASAVTARGGEMLASLVVGSEAVDQVAIGDGTATLTHDLQEPANVTLLLECPSGPAGWTATIDF